MQSSIITEEILRLHMIEESEKLLSDIKPGEVGHHFFLVKVMVRIYRYHSSNNWGTRELIYENKGFPPKTLVRWKWYFRYLQSKEQIKTPKQLIQIETISYVTPDRDKVLLKVLNNKLSAAKRDRTKVQMAIEAGKKATDDTSLFSYEYDPNYQKALQKLSEKQQLVSDIEAEIAELSLSFTHKQ